jgi:hypothetical protein
MTIRKHNRKICKLRDIVDEKSEALHVSAATNGLRSIFPTTNLCTKHIKTWQVDSSGRTQTLPTMFVWICATHCHCVHWIVCQLICFDMFLVSNCSSTSKGLHVSLSTQTRSITASHWWSPRLPCPCSRREIRRWLQHVCSSARFYSPVIHVIRANTTSISFFEINGSHVDTLWTIISKDFRS